jgi:hypothetical protein
MAARGKTYGLLKFGKREHLDGFSDKGFLYLNTLRYFQELEADTERGDTFEALDTIIQPQHLGEAFLTHISLRKRVPILPQDLTGPIQIRLNRTMEYNVYCMFAIKGPVDGDLIPARGAGLGEWFLLVLNPTEFVSRVSMAAKTAGFNCQYAPVEYYDPKHFSGYVGPFRKRLEYSYQKEFRFVFQPGRGQPLTLQAGSLADITSEVLPTFEMNTRLDFSSNSFQEAGFCA